MCETTYCLYPWFVDSIILTVVLVAVAGLVVWKLVKALIETIPFL